MFQLSAVHPPFFLQSEISFSLSAGHLGTGWKQVLLHSISPAQQAKIHVHLFLAHFTSYSCSVAKLPPSAPWGFEQTHAGLGAGSSGLLTAKHKFISTGDKGGAA
jgi:hypothetical protein